MEIFRVWWRLVLIFLKFFFRRAIFVCLPRRKFTFLRGLLVFILVIGWIFSGWPVIWENPPVPPKIEVAKANPAEYLSNPSFTGGTTNWTLSVTTYDSTTYQDTAGSINTNPGAGNRNGVAEGYTTQTISTQINSSDTVNLSLYFQKTWTAVASARQNIYAQIEKPSAPGTWVTIWSNTTVYQSSGWISVSPTDVSSYFDETGAYGFRFWVSLRNGNDASVNTNLWVDNVSLDVTSAGTLTVDIVDSGGNPVASPTMAMDAVPFSFNYQTANGTFGVSTQKIRVNNTTANPAWSLTIAASGGSGSLWSNSGETKKYDFNDPTANAEDGADTPDTYGGQMTLNASVGILTPQAGCTNTGLTLGSSASFSEGVTDSITLLTTGASADTSCYWDFTGVSVSQTIPASQSIDTYTLDLTLTVTP